MLRTFLANLLLVTLVSAAPAQVAAGKVTSQISVKPGQVLHFIETNEVRATLDDMPYSSTSQSREFTLVFGQRLPDGALPAKLTYTRLFGWQRDKSRDRVEFDTHSSKDIALPDILFQIDLLNKEMEIRFDSSGKIVSFSGMTRALIGDSAEQPGFDLDMDFDKSTLATYRMLFGSLPETGAKVGESWDENLTLSLVGISLKGTISKTLKSSTEDSIEIVHDGKLEINLGPNVPTPPSAKMSRVTSKGNSIISQSTGITQRAEWQQAMTLEMARPGSDTTMVLMTATTTSLKSIPEPTPLPNSPSR